MKVNYSRSVGDTLPAHLLAIEGLAELARGGHAPSGLDVFRPSDQMFYAVSDEGDPVGVLCFRFVADTDRIVITQLYVEPSSRGQGVAKALMDVMAEYAKTSEMDIIAQVSVTLAADALKHLGFAPMLQTFVRTK